MKMGKIIDNIGSKQGFELTLDTTLIDPHPRSFIILSYPNNTQITINGDPDIVKQLVNRLDHQIIEYSVNNRDDN